MLSVRVVCEDSPGTHVLGQWPDLLSEAVFATPFQTPAWTSTWWRHFGGHRRPYWLTLYEGQDLVGLYPLFVTNGPWRTLRPMGTGHSDYLHPLARAGYQQTVNNAVVSHIAELQDVDMADLHQLREGVGPAAGDDEPEIQATCLSLDLPATYDEYLKGLSKSLRFDCRRMNKEPFTSGKAEIKAVDESMAPQAIETFFQLHSKRWRSRWQPGAFATNKIRAFHRSVAVQLAKEGHLRMSVMTVEDRPAGVFYGMKTAGTTFFYQCGFDPEYKALSPGTLLVAHAINTSITEGGTKFDFMRGDEGYKRRWNPQHSHRNLRYILPLNSGLGSVGRAFNHVGAKLEEKVRTRLEGRSLV